MTTANHKAFQALSQVETLVCKLAQQMRLERNPDNDMALDSLHQIELAILNRKYSDGRKAGVKLDPVNVENYLVD
jgi:hypothetical protein